MANGKTVTPVAKTTPVKPSVKATQQAVAKAASVAPATAPKNPNVVAKIHCHDWEKLKAATGLDIYAPALTVEDAKTILGWQTENDYLAKLKEADKDINEDEVRNIFGKDHFLTDLNKNRVQLKNNLSNRPWSETVSKGYMNDILKRYWRLNGETMIIGVNGRVLSGQHRLIGMIFAEQERTSEKAGVADHWADNWKGPITLECVVVHGIPETPDITRTLDNVKSRTLSDIIYADTDLFGKYKPAERRVVSRMLDYAVKMLWTRTGEKGDGWTLKRTHSESLDFVTRHPKLKDCIIHIYEEDKGEKGLIKKYVYPGHAAALMYLMGCSGTKEDDIEDYFVQRLTKPSDEKKLNWGNFKKAKMFWSDIARESPEMKGVRTARMPLITDEPDSYTGIVFTFDEESEGSDHQKWGTLIRAWNAYVADEPVENLELAYETKKQEDDPDSPFWSHHLKEYPTVANSIDKGDAPVVKTPKAAKDADEDADNPDHTEDLTDEEGDAKAESKGGSASQSMKEAWDDDKQNFAGHLFLYKSKVSGNHIAYFDDAQLISTLTGAKVVKHPQTGDERVVLGGSTFATDCAKITEAGHEILISENGDDGERTLTPWGNEGDQLEAVEAPESPAPATVPATTPGDGNNPPANASTASKATTVKRVIKRK